MATTQGYKGSVRGQTGVAAAFTDEVCTELSVDFTRYQITDATKRFWPLGVAVVVEVDDGGGFAAVDAADYAVQYLGGIITFDPPLAGDYPVQVTGTAYPMAEFAGFTEWSADLSVAELDTTALSAASTGATTFIPGLFKAAVSCAGWWDDEYFFDKLIDRAVVVLSLLTGAADGGHYDCYTYVGKIAPAVKVDDLVTESREFVVSGRFFYNQG